MKIKRIVLLIIAAIGFSVPLSSCSSVGNLSGVAAAGARYYVAKDLSKAKTAAAWQAKHDRWSNVVAALEAVEKDGLTIEALTAVLSTKLKPEEAALAQALVTLLPSNGLTGMIDLHFLDATVAALRADLALPPPVFASAS